MKERDREMRGAGARGRAVSYGSRVVLCALIFGGLYLSSAYSYLLFHNLVELASALAAMLVFVIAWNTRRVLDNHYVLFIGISSLFTGALTLVHTLAYQGMEVLPRHATDMGTQFWIAYRYVFGASFLLAPVFLGRKVPTGPVIAVYAAVTFLLTSGIFLGIFPRCYIEGEGMTPFKIGSEYAVSLALAVALVSLWRKRSSFHPRIFEMMGLSMLASLCSVVSYAQYTVIVGPASMAGHFFELLATYAIYQAVVVTGLVEPADLLFHGLKQSEEALRRANDSLQSEIAERRRAEDQLVRIATAVGSAAEAVVITDPATGTIQYVNSAFLQITGYAVEEALGRNISELESNARDPDAAEEPDGGTAGDGIRQGTRVSRRKDGSPYFEEFIVSPVRDQAGKVINYVHLKRDVTERIRLESASESAHALESIGQVFSGVRNEIGNPVNSMNMILGVLRSRLASLPPESIEHYLGLMTDQVSRVEHLLRSIKNFSLYETHVPQTVAVPRFLENLIEPLRTEYARQGIVVELRVAPDADRVHADPRALQQVLINVLNNAVDAVQGRPAPKVVITASRSSGSVRFRVEDNGRGIPKDRMQEIFKPFYSTRQQGTGLGLVVVKKMLSMMRGSIALESSEDAGTIADIFIPEGPA